LARSPLCVCHFQSILREPQVKISKHLAYLRKRGLVATKRQGNWIIYSLPKRRSAELAKNLKCLQDCAQTHTPFKSNFNRLKQLRKSCCDTATIFARKNR